ncbi:MAG TPA: alpha/beta hydrolase [Candidatus Limnocylindrales bacterium]|nr:alpha/beta hydrolase [Candidatus Limnocylindrales bacterium]
MQSSGRFLEVGGERIHLLERGSGPPLLLVHGFPSNATAWAMVMDRLEPHFAMTAVDMVGFGQSTRRPRRPLTGEAYADRLVALMDALRLERPRVAGLSWGGSVVQRLAARHPRRIDRLVLVASASAGRALALTTANLLGLAVAIRFPALGRLAVRRFVTGAAGRGPATDHLVRGYTEPLQVPGTLAALRRFVRDTAATPPIDLAEIRALTLVIVPHADRIVAPDVGAEIAASIPNARLELLPGIGHAVQFEAPDRVANLMLDFLRQR